MDRAVIGCFSPLHRVLFPGARLYKNISPASKGKIMFFVRLITLHPDFEEPVEMAFHSDFGTEDAIMNMLGVRAGSLILHMDIERVQDE